MNKKFVITFGIVALLIIISGVAYAATDGVINACMNKSDGTIRIVSDPTKCK